MDKQLLDYLSFVTVKKGLAVNSIKHCRIRIALLFRWLDTNEKELNKTSVEEFIYYLKEEKRLRNNSLNTYLFALRMYRDYCQDRGMPYNFLDGFASFKKEKPVIIILTPEEIEKLINAQVRYGSNSHVSHDVERSRIANQRYGVLTHFLAMTGCRLAEATNLKRKYIDLTLGTATFTDTKNKDHRRVFIGQPLLNRLCDLVEHKKDEELVFTNDNNKKIIPTNYMLYLSRLRKEAGVTKRVHPHIFRHSMATQLLMEGVDVSLVATILGHKDIQTTFDNYVHLADTTIKKAQFRHPLLRKSLSIPEVLTYVKELLDTSMVKDERFDIETISTKGSISFKMLAK